MSGNESKSGLSAKQNAAIIALLSEPTTKRAAEVAKVAEVTLHRWLNDPGFSAALKESRERVFEGTLATLQGVAGRAVETLLDVMQDKEAQPSARVSAAKAVLELALRGRDQLELADRMKQIEERLQLVGGVRQ